MLMECRRRKVSLGKKSEKNCKVVESASYASYSTDDEQSTKQNQGKINFNQNVDGISVNELSVLKSNFDPNLNLNPKQQSLNQKLQRKKKSQLKSTKFIIPKTFQESPLQSTNSKPISTTKTPSKQLKSSENLKKTENFLLKFLKILNLEVNHEKSYVFSLFQETKRILNLKFDSELVNGNLNHFCILGFSSQSSARKTLAGYKNWHKHKVHWVSQTGGFISDAHYAQQKINFYRQVGPTFDYSLFERDPVEFIYAMAIDSSCPVLVTSFQTTGCQILLGNELIKALN